MTESESKSDSEPSKKNNNYADDNNYKFRLCMNDKCKNEVKFRCKICFIGGFCSDVCYDAINKKHIKEDHIGLITIIKDIIDKLLYRPDTYLLTNMKLHSILKPTNKSYAIMETSETKWIDEPNLFDYFFDNLYIKNNIDKNTIFKWYCRPIAPIIHIIVASCLSIILEIFTKGALGDIDKVYSFLGLVYPRFNIKEYRPKVLMLANKPVFGISIIEGDFKDEIYNSKNFSHEEFDIIILNDERDKEKIINNIDNIEKEIKKTPNDTSREYTYQSHGSHYKKLYNNILITTFDENKNNYYQIDLCTNSYMNSPGQSPHKYFDINIKDVSENDNNLFATEDHNIISIKNIISDCAKNDTESFCAIQNSMQLFTRQILINYIKAETKIICLQDEKGFDDIVAELKKKTIISDK